MTPKFRPMLINELKLYSDNIEEQIDFYTSVLGVRCIGQSDERASFQLGSSVLTFEFKHNATPYHFAINIPSNKEYEALQWLKERVKILMGESIELHDFDFWNARAFYFYDHDMNIVELIARKNLHYHVHEPFDSSQLLSISEIGMPTTDIEARFQQLNKLSGIEPYDGGFERFLAVGDEKGLFICINKERKDWFPTGDTTYSSDFELHFTDQENDYHIQFVNDQIFDLTPTRSSI